MASIEYTTIIVGTGFSGLALAIKLKEKGIHDFVILEKASDVGGTWRENTYPGAECDIPSALYSYSFEPYTDWKYKWSLQPQILEYILHVVEKYRLHQHIVFNQEVTDAEWTKNGHWRISTKEGKNFNSRTFVSAIGQLHYPSIPDLEGANSFKGPQWHSSQWNHNVDLKGQSVGVIGNAASAVQFIPEIAKVAKRVTIFQRSANWMLPKQDREYRAFEKKIVALFPFLLKLYRLRLWLIGGAFFFLMKRGNEFLRKIYEKQSKKFIEEHIKDKNTIEALIPNFPMGAKRVLFSDTYYPALSRDNVQLVTKNIQKITANGINIDNEEHIDFDVIIYATGFVSNPFFQHMTIKGKNGIYLNDHWKEGPKNYLGICTHQFPNFFMMYGPNTNLGHNSIILMSEAQASYITKCISEIKQRNLKSFEVKKEAEDTYFDQCQKRLQNMIWSQVDKSWYKSENGNIPNNYPGRTMEYMKVTKNVKFDDFLAEK